MDWGAVIQAVGNLGTAALNYGANERTNSTNRYMNRENNEWNERLWREQLQWNENMYNKYQSPEMQLKSQMKAMQELGLNPNLMLGHAAGSAGGVAGATPPQMVASRDVAPQIGLDLSPLAQYGLKDAQRESLQASTDAQLIKNRFAVMRERYELEEKLANTKLTDTQRQHLKRQIKMLDIEARYQDDYLKARNDTQRETANLARNQALTEHYKGEYQQMVNSAFPQLNSAQLNLLASQSFSAYKAGIASQASANLSDEMKRHEAIKAIGSTIENGIKSGQFSAQQLGMSKLEIEALRDKRYLDWLKMSKLNRVIDGIADVAGSIPASILKGLK